MLFAIAVLATTTASFATSGTAEIGNSAAKNAGANSPFYFTAESPSDGTGVESLYAAAEIASASSTELSGTSDESPGHTTAEISDSSASAESLSTVADSNGCSTAEIHDSITENSCAYSPGYVTTESPSNGTGIESLYAVPEIDRSSSAESPNTVATTTNLCLLLLLLLEVHTTTVEPVVVMAQCNGS